MLSNRTEPYQRNGNEIGQISGNRSSRWCCNKVEVLILFWNDDVAYMETFSPGVGLFWVFFTFLHGVFSIHCMLPISLSVAELVSPLVVPGVEQYRLDLDALLCL